MLGRRAPQSHTMINPWEYVVGKDWGVTGQEARTPMWSTVVTQRRNADDLTRIVAAAIEEWSSLKTIYEGGSTV